MKVVEAQEIFRRFNEGRYWERAQAGELSQQLRRNGHPSPPLASEPFCTRSQIIAYHDASGTKVAVVHQYLRENGTVGLSGRPDPQYLFSGGVIYKKARRPQPRASAQGSVPSDL